MKKYFVYNDGEFEYFKTKKKAHNFLNKIIQNSKCADSSEWDLDFESSFVGKILYEPLEFDYKYPKGILDKNGEDENGVFWAGPDAFTCDFRLGKVTNNVT